jgi:formate/nitrite transporter FocA (FNT family)
MAQREPQSDEAALPRKQEGESGKHQSVNEVFQPLVEEGQGQLQRPVPDLLLSGLIAGLDIGFGPLAMAVVAGRLHLVFHLSVESALFYGSFLYPLGFVLVIMGKSELFTENTLAPVAGLLTGTGTLPRLARSWSLILSLNIVGTVLFSLLVSHIDTVFVPYRAEYRAMGTPLVSQPFLQAMLAGVLGGWLVALIAWLVESTKGSAVHFIVIYSVAYLLVGLTLVHSIIGSIEVLLGMFAGAPITWVSWFTRFLVPAVIGNVIGGVVFVTALKGFQAKVGESA